MRRRTFLRTSAAAAVGTSLAGCSSQPLSTATTPELSENPFQHGVASGDPLQDRVILWTRITASADAAIPVAWWIATDAEGVQRVAQGEAEARPERDFTVKVDAPGLTPATNYFYGFTTGSYRSPVGRTRTIAASGTAPVRLVMTSCANYPQGYFNAYADIARRDDIDVVLSLGDYIYEYEDGAYGNGAKLGRVPQPNREILTLQDYRLRHAQHKAEADLQAAHGAHPWIVVWDDHESANNSWSGGAQNHDEGEGLWQERKAAAIRAYYEWMPIRDVPTGLFRRFAFGELAHVIMLDTRLAGRDEQVAPDNPAAAANPQRSLLGPIQEADLLRALSEANEAAVTWKLLGQQIVFAPMAGTDGPFNPDSWDGYRASRQVVMDHIQAESIENVVVLTGDVHSSWGVEVRAPGADRNLAVEFVTPAVSSPPLGTNNQQMADLVKQLGQHPAVKFIDGMHNGYLDVLLSTESATAQWRFTGHRETRDSSTRLGATAVCRAGASALEVTTS